MNLPETGASHRSAGILGWARFAAGYNGVPLRRTEEIARGERTCCGYDREHVNPARLVTPFVSMPGTRYIS